MMQRRHFLGTTAAAAMGGALPSGPAGAADAAAGMALPAKLHLLVDPRQARSVADAAAAASTGSGHVVHELQPRLDLHWVRDLFASLRRDGAALRGATRAADHFVLRQLAFDEGYVAAAEAEEAEEATLPGDRNGLVRWTLVPRPAGDRSA